MVGVLDPQDKNSRLRPSQYIITSLLGEVQSIYCDECVCLSVCLLASSETTRPNFLCTLTVHVRARSFSNDVAIRYAPLFANDVMFSHNEHMARCVHSIST